MSPGVKKISRPIIAAAVVAAAACAAWFGYLWYIKSPGYAEKHKYDDIYEMYADDEHFVGVIDGVLWFDYDYTDLFFNTGRGLPGSPCNHDLSYTEPVIPVGKYYPGGDEGHEYYMEVTEENGRYFFEYKNADGTPYGPADESDQFYGNTGKHEFVVITSHQYEDVWITTSWKNRSDYEEDPYGGLWQGEKVLFGHDDDSVRFRAYFDEDGSVSMDILHFANKFSENEYNMSDKEAGLKLSLPE